jgi:hypothetical protein
MLGVSRRGAKGATVAGPSLQVLVVALSAPSPLRALRSVPHASAQFLN